MESKREEVLPLYAAKANTFAKNASLAALVLQQVGLVVFIRYSRTLSSGTTTEPYLASTVVVSAEALKILLNLFLEVNNRGKGGDEDEGEGPPSVFYKQFLTKSSLSLLVPALAYVIQNNLLFVALSNLSVPVYQVTNQGKLLTTAVLSRMLLGKQLSWMQYFSLVLLALGVALVQLTGKTKTASCELEIESQDQLLGLVAVICSCFTSGFAGVYFEKMLKSSTEVSVYVRNVQLAFWSILLGLVPLAFDWKTISTNGFFQGYTLVVWTVIVCQAMTGLLVALVMKYADAILKGFATSVAVVVATVLSFFIFDSQLDDFFLTGATLVMVAVKMYTKYPYEPDKQQDPNTDESTTTFPKRRKHTSTVVVALVILIPANLNLLHSTSIRFASTSEFVILPETKIGDDGNSRILSFPNDGDAMRLPPFSPANVTYYRTQGDIASYENSTDCATSIEVLAWLMDKINDHQETLMIGYGELIHMLREREFVRPNGQYIDDDFDTWVTYEAFRFAATLEPEMWQNFGWTLRIYSNCTYHTLFGQLVSACGHRYSTLPGKAIQYYPAIELYPLNINATRGTAKDLWQGLIFPTDLMFPQKHLDFQSNGTDATLHLQIPRYSEKILTCLYGNWSVYSKAHCGEDGAAGDGANMTQCLADAALEVAAKVNV